MGDTNRNYTVRAGDGDSELVLPIVRDCKAMSRTTISDWKSGAYKEASCGYGCIVGTVRSNDGVGIPNAKISVFFQKDSNKFEEPYTDVVYPYITPLDKDMEGTRYNTLVRNVYNYNDDKRSDGIGSFPSKREVLDNGFMSDVFSRYYRYTATTNENGEYMLFGIPVGEQKVHMDLDLSDIGGYSQTPEMMIERGYSENSFDVKETRGSGVVDDIVSSDVSDPDGTFSVNGVSEGTDGGIKYWYIESQKDSDRCTLNFAADKWSSGYLNTWVTAFERFDEMLISKNNADLKGLEERTSYKGSVEDLLKEFEPSDIGYTSEGWKNQRYYRLRVCGNIEKSQITASTINDFKDAAIEKYILRSEIDDGGNSGYGWYLAGVAGEKTASDDYRKQLEDGTLLVLRNRPDDDENMGYYGEKSCTFKRVERDGFCLYDEVITTKQNDSLVVDLNGYYRKCITFILRYEDEKDNKEEEEDKYCRIYRVYVINGKVNKTYNFKNSKNLDDLVHINSLNQNVYVHPYWGDTENGDIATTKCDFTIGYNLK